MRVAESAAGAGAAITGGNAFSAGEAVVVCAAVVVGGVDVVGVDPVSANTTPTPPNRIVNPIAQPRAGTLAWRRGSSAPMAAHLLSRGSITRQRAAITSTALLVSEVGRSRKVE